MKAFNQLNHDEAERLALLAEECAEAIQIIGKILRHGYESSHPHNRNETNREMLERELGDIRAAMLLMLAAGDVSGAAVSDAANWKSENVGRYLHEQATPDQGAPKP